MWVSRCTRRLSSSAYLFTITNDGDTGALDRWHTTGMGFKSQNREFSAVRICPSFRMCGIQTTSALSSCRRWFHPSVISRDVLHSGREGSAGSV